ncbi:acyl--CoA ligase [Nocardioides albidus]|uniref:Acyl--CoA ligase n=1 Tax=Nocardioides albidus TaxID=1517589 RepID=A0A5C4W728_9ACTN|nr:class I adenylate-forming enzyme family protein [Nocardioides albidus]TNM44134.1 acyl--CoA ligase [Nocardioides albidus]
MIELLRRAAEEGPDRAAVVIHEQVVSYGELLARAEGYAAELTSRGLRRFATFDGDAARVIALLAAASACGVELCQFPPAEPESVAELAARFDHTVVLSADPDLDAGDAEVLDHTVWPTVPGAAGAQSSPAADARPHLILTTGTTGAPRGVRHDWSRLVRGVHRVRETPHERWLLAYGLHQFAGLQVLLHVAAARATLVAPAPRTPRAGLRAMRELGVTHASATPTYWRFLLTELAADGAPAPSLRQITLGGEAVPGPLLAQLERTFPDAAISQVYAASEFGSSGSVKDRRAGLSRSVLERGDDADVAMRIVDGELWVRSRVGMLGYHGDPPVEDPDGWRATGDLVELVGDRVEFRGRSSDIINVGGTKVHPLPIEERVSSVPGVAVARVWGRPSALTGNIVAVDVVPAPGADPARVKAAIGEACADLAGAARPRSIRFVDEIPVRGSKIVRRDIPQEGRG